MTRTNRELIEGLLYIQNKRKERVPFKLNPAQAFYWEKKRRRNLILKARQKGLSKVIDADQLIDCVRKSTNAVVISHETEATKRLFSAVKYYVDNLEVKPYVTIDSKREMKFPKRGSTYFIGTAGQRAFGRGDTIDRVHLSEAAFYQDLKKTLAGITEAAEYGQIDIETTPNGRDAFYDMWQDAKNGRSPYTPIFIPWFIDEEYSIDSMTEADKEGLSDAMQEIFAIPDAEFKKQYTEEEKALIKRVEAEYDMTLTPGQIKWRRYKIWDKGDLFFQEYPEDDETCFLQSGRAVFTSVTVDPSLQVPLDDIKNWDEEDKKALKSRTLYAGVDGAEGIQGGDNHVFAVIDAPAGGKAKVIYEYASSEPIDVFWGKVAKIVKAGRFVLGIEKNGVGVAHIQMAQQLGVPHKAWDTTGTSRPILIADLEEAYRKKELVESYPEAETEIRNMVYSGKGNRPEHPKGKHDDRVFARGIAYQMTKVPTPRVTRL
jgi:hypothetical protein